MPATAVVTDYVDDPGWDPSGTNLSTFGVANDLKQRDIDNEVHELTKEVTPLTTALTHPDLRSRPAYAPRIEWFERDIMPRIVAAALGSTTGSASITTVPVATGYGPYFRPGDLVKNDATGELMLVTGQSADNLTVQRGIGAGGTGVIFSATSDTLVRISNAAQQGAYNVPIRSIQPSLQYNNTQIFRYKDGVTNTQAASRTVQAVQDLYLDKMNQKARESKRDLEQAIWEGKRDLVLVAGQHPRGTMGGIFSFLSTNVTSFAGGTDLDLKTIETKLRQVARYSAGGNVVAFVSPLVMSALNSFPLGRIALASPDATRYGVQIRSWQGGGIEVPLVQKVDWGDRSTTSPAPGGFLAFINLDNVRLRWLRPLRLYDDRKVYGDEDAKAGEWLGEVSLMVSNEQSHAILRNITQYA